jgi:chromosome segregation ATPase
LAFTAHFGHSRTREGDSMNIRIRKAAAIAFVAVAATVGLAACGSDSTDLQDQVNQSIDDAQNQLNEQLQNVPAVEDAQQQLEQAQQELQNNVDNLTGEQRQQLEDAVNQAQDQLDQAQNQLDDAQQQVEDATQPVSP